MSNQLQGRIVKILDEIRLIANIGFQEGVAVGDLFVVYEPGEEVTDTESGESLGQLELVKAQVEAVHVQERMVILSPRTFTEKETLSGTVLSAIMARTNSGSEDRKKESLTVRRDQVAGMPVVRPIQVGDSVRRVSN